MRVLLLAALFVSVPAEESGFSSTINELTNKLGELGFIGDTRESGLAQGRSLIMSSLLASVQGATSMDADIKAVLNKVPPIIDNILGDLRAERGVHLASANGCGTKFDDCNVSATLTNDINAEADASGKHDIHHACRANLKDDYNTLVGNATHPACQAFWSYLELVNGDPATYACVMDAADGFDLTHESGEAWTTAVEALENKWVNNVENVENLYKTKRNACKTAWDAYDTQHGECNGDQESWRNTYCGWVTKRVDRCNVQFQCYDNAHKHMDNVIAIINPAQSQRMKDAAVLFFVKCAVNWLANSVNDPKDAADVWDHCVSHLSADYSADYGLAMPTAPAELACVYHDAANGVQNSNGEATFYGQTVDVQWPWTGLATVDVGNHPWYGVQHSNPCADETIYSRQCSQASGCS